MRNRRVSRPRPSARRSTRTALVVAILLFLWAFLYRFNTLGGGYGGFDNDHFLYIALAKQVQAGEQPLRDFTDAMHGAWPSLTYELSAAAQRYLGNNLRSEALLTVSGIALAAVVTFLAGRAVAPWPWALLTAVLSVLLSPKLYGYPKVLVTAVASLLIVGGSGTPTWGRVAAMSVWTAVAFLFRHDYAVYCAIGFLALIGLSTALQWRQRVQRAGAYVVISAVLLLPSVWWIQQYRGVTEYVRNSLEMSRNEYERTRIGWPGVTLDGVQSLSGIFDREENAEAWLYYVFLALPAAGLGVAGVMLARPQRDPRFQVVTWSQTQLLSTIALMLMTAALAQSFLRGNLGARFGDMGPPVAVLAAFLLAAATKPRRPWPRMIATGGVAMAVLATSVVSIWRLGSVASELRSARLLDPPNVFAYTKQISDELSQMPRSVREAEAGDRMQAIDYLHRCTRPTDRVMAVGYYPEVPVLSERLFAGGRVTFVVGYYAHERYSRETIALLERDSVPIVVGGMLLDTPRIPLLADYLRTHYEEKGTVTMNDGSLRVLVRRGISGPPLGPNGLPCFG